MQVFGECATVVAYTTYTTLMHKVRLNCFTTFVVDQTEQEVSKCFTFGVVAWYYCKCINYFTCNCKVFFNYTSFPQQIQCNCCMLTLWNTVTSIRQFDTVYNLYCSRIKRFNNMCYVIPINITLIVYVNIQQLKCYKFNTAEVFGSVCAINTSS